MPFTFLVDSNGKAGAVKSVNEGNNFVVPVQIQATDGITPVDASHPLHIVLTAGTAEIGKLAAGDKVIGKIIPVNADGTEKFTTAKPGVVEVSGSKAKITSINADSSTEIEATAGVEIITITPSAGYKARLLNFYIDVLAVSGASSGTQEIYLYQGLVGDEWANTYCYLTGAYNKRLRIKGNIIDTSQPDQVLMMGMTSDQLQRNIMAIEFTTTNPLRIKIFNKTDVAQTANRRIRLVVSEEAIV